MPLLNLIIVLSYGLIYECLADRHLSAFSKSAVENMGNYSTTCLRHQRLEAEYFSYHPFRFWLTPTKSFLIIYCLSSSEFRAMSGRIKKGKAVPQQMHENMPQALQEMKHGFSLIRYIY